MYVCIYISIFVHICMYACMQVSMYIGVYILCIMYECVCIFCIYLFICILIQALIDLLSTYLSMCTCLIY